MSHFTFEYDISGVRTVSTMVPKKTLKAAKRAADTYTVAMAQEGVTIENVKFCEVVNNRLVEVIEK